MILIIISPNTSTFCQRVFSSHWHSRLTRHAASEFLNAVGGRLSAASGDLIETSFCGNAVQF